MIDYSKWKEAYLIVTNLLLDPHNPRIPDSGENLSQRDLLADLVANDKVYELAKSIVENGYYPVEALIIVEENKKKYVVEGNRRLAALKLLLSPETAPNENWERRFRALANRIDPNAIRKVKVIRAPSREAAAPVIMSKHTRSQIESWSPLMQAKFYRNLVDRGLTVDDIAEQYNLNVSEITDALQRYTMYAVACALDLPEDIAKKVQNPREFPITNLERLYKNPKVNRFLGISFDENKNLIGSVKVNEFKKGYTKIVTDIAKGEVHSRKLNTTAEMDEYLKSFGDQKPDLTKKGRFTAATLLKTGTKRKAIPKTSATKKKPKSKPRPRALIPSSFSCDVNNQRINDVFTELKKLPVAQYPNAVGLMFRSLLEISLGYYLDRTGHLEKMRSTEEAKRKKKNQNLPRDWHPTLSEMLRYIVNKDTDIIRNGNLLKALRKLIDQKHELLSIDSLNLFVHNQHFYPNEDILRRFWQQLEGLFQIILVEPDGNEETG
ncbi:MAG: hypothetical protein JRJ13_14465 [Deltaproteobacteria bacterium]|nr:hypothetical protein [Deltaproteobacteria bacterium]MBW1930341.1 hypothetical protein [Deltaproteobacteria bacterium]RLC08238.1 MAG: hypothetical protein DRH43_10415 [Deltaproteobacteria bacterium]